MAEGGISTKEHAGLLNFIFPISAAIALRSASAAYADVLSERVEFTSVFYSFNQLKDAVALLEDGLDPYETKNMHFPPLILHLFRCLLNHQSLLLPIFILLDVATAWMTSLAARKVWKGSEDIGVLVFSFYAFNPITIISTGILSLTVLQNFALAAIFLFFVTDRPALCAMVIGAWSSFTVYPAILLSCLVFRANGSTGRFISWIGVGISTAIAFLAVNYVLNGQNFNFVNSVYSSILNFSSIQPNVGLYWYFFVQIFEHFRSFYTISFTLLFFFMPIPITFMMRRDAVLHFTVIALLVSIFFPYPTLNQVTVILAILPLHQDYKKHFRYTLLIAGTLVSTIVLMPVMWHMWMVSSSGNANFFFGATIIYNVALINLVMDMIFVYSRQQIDKEYGVKKATKMEFAFY